MGRMVKKSLALLALILLLCFWSLTSGLSLGQSIDMKPAQSKPYRYSSLKGLSNEKLFEYMGKAPGVEAREWAERNRHDIPGQSWSIPPEGAALALLAATQSSDGKQGYTVALGRPEGGPPAKGTLTFSNYSDRSYNDVRYHYFVRFSPEGSFFAYAMTLSPGMVGYDITRDETAYDLRACKLTYEEARHFAQVIWWLGWAETKEKAGIPRSDSMRFGLYSTADGRGYLSLASEDGGRAVNEYGILHEMSPGSWEGKYDREAYLNVARFAVDRALWERVAKRWPEDSADRMTRFLGISRGADEYTRDELSGLRDAILVFLKLYTPDGRQISHRHVVVAAQAAGDLALTEAVAFLGNIRKNLPPPSAAKKKGGRTLEEIRKELEALRASTDPDEFMEKAEGLMDEYFRVQSEMDGGSKIDEELGAATAVALRKIEMAEDVPALAKWAESRDPGSAWAASRLLKKSPSVYADVLAGWLDRARPEHKAEILHAIYRAHPQKALEIAAKVPPGERSGLSTAAAEILESSGLLSGDKYRIASLIQVALNKKMDWEERNRAIDLLVPKDNPGKFPDKAIDDALVTLVESETSKGFMPNFTLSAAALALAWRNRVDQLDKLVGVLEDQGSHSMAVLSADLLSAVTYLARKGKDTELKKLALVIAPHFKRTNMQITEILWSAWAANLREFESDIERIATASTADEEGRKATSFGGAVTEVTERYHLARKIAALWNEEDFLTRGKLVIAFGFSEAYEFVESEALERGEHMKEVLAALAREATPADLKALGEFMTWSEDMVIQKEAEPVYRRRMEAFARIARGILGI
jgi:hypothetical protein